MRIFHTSDWHLGRLTYGQSRRADMVAAFEESLAIARDFKPDLVLHSGDLFDASRPSVEEMSLAHEMLRRLGECAPVVVVAGNHDSGALFELFEALLGHGRLHFVPSIRAPKQGGVLEFPGPDGELARVICMPFLHANRVVDALEVKADMRTLSYADRVAGIQTVYARHLEQTHDPSRHVNLLVAHLHVDGATWSRSERPLHVSSNYASRASAIPPVSYAAFGHIHKPQALPGNLPGWYVGSMIQLDFGEEGETKQVLLVEASPGRAARITPAPLTAGRQLLTLEGTQEELERRAGEVTNPLLRLVVHTPRATPGLPDWAVQLFPQATLLDLTERCLASKLELVSDDLSDQETFEDLEQAFRAYLADNAPGDLNGDELLGLFQELLRGEEAPERSELTELLEVLA